MSRTNLLVSKIYASNSIIHVFGFATPSSGAVKYNNRTVYDSSGYRYTVHLMLDSSGNLVNYKSIVPRTIDQSIQNVLYVSTYLLSFNARIDNNNTVAVNWKMVSGDIRQCLVQRSHNGDSFKDVDLKNGLNNSSISTYHTEDKLNAYGQYHHRLKMISNDGGISYSNISRVLYTGKTGVCYYDNNSRQLHILQPVDTFYQYTIFDAGGRTILTNQATGGKIVSLHTQPNGMYIIQIRKEGGATLSYKFIK